MTEKKKVPKSQDVKLNQEDNSNVHQQSSASREDSSGAATPRDHEIESLREQISRLQLEVGLLRSEGDVRDQAMASVYQQLYQQTSVNRKLKRELDAAKTRHAREKEALTAEVDKLHRRLYEGGQPPPQGSRCTSDKCRVKYSRLRRKLRQVREEQDRRISELCMRYFRLKEKKDALIEYAKQLDDERDKILSQAKRYTEQASQELRIVTDRRFKIPLPPRNALTLEMARRNTRLRYENSELRLQLVEARKLLVFSKTSLYLPLLGDGSERKCRRRRRRRVKPKTASAPDASGSHRESTPLPEGTVSAPDVMQAAPFRLGQDADTEQTASA